jgi:hypothetical protein
VSPAKPIKRSIKIRIPGWARNQPVPGDLYRFLTHLDSDPTIQVNNQKIPLALNNGYAVISRKWYAGDHITINFPMPIRRIIAHTEVKDCQDKVALQRGPVVYCSEWPEYRDHRVLDLYMPDTTSLSYSFNKDLLGGTGIISGDVKGLKWNPKQTGILHRSVKFTAIPYSVWNNRGPGEMRIWFPRSRQAAAPRPLPSIASRSTFTASSSFATGLNDQYDPGSSSDTSKPFFNWWQKHGTTEWVQYNFKKRQMVSETSVYWLEISHHDAHIRVPESWRLLYKKGDIWLPVLNRTPYSIFKDQYNQVLFDPIKTNALRIEVKLQPEYSGGIIEWKVE